MGPTTLHSATLLKNAGPTALDLPQGAQSLVSATLGRDDATYHFRVEAEGYRAVNSSGTLITEFTDGSLRLEAGGNQWQLSLQSMGDGEVMQAVSPVAPTVVANRLEYVHGTFTEWYVNGPAGLEQGWTITSPPREAGRGLTLALALEGNARVGAGGRLLELVGADGAPALRYTGLYAQDATGRELRAEMELGGPLATIGGVSPRTPIGGVPLLIRVDDAGAQYPVTVDPYVMQAALTNAGAAANDYLGASVAISADGSTIVAGAPVVSSSRGAAYVFVKGGGGWGNMSAPTATLTNAAGAANDYLGSSVAISADGSTIVAGAPVVSSYAGAAYVFQKGGSSWATTGTPTATLTNSSGPAGERLGTTVAMSADASTIVVGAFLASFESKASLGAAYVFVRPGSSWATTGTPTAMLSNSTGGAAGDRLGRSVAMTADGATVVAGADGVSSYAGAAYVFAKGNGWANMSTPTAMLTNATGEPDAYLGNSVAISADGTTIVAGAYGASSWAGAAYVFVRPGSSWATTGTPIAVLTNAAGAANDMLGISLAISSDGSTIVAGAYGASSWAGAAYVFARGSGWANMSTPTDTLTNATGVAYDSLGSSAAISADGTTIVAGAEGVNNSRGAAYVFFQPSSNANLSSLVLSSGTLSPAFASGTTSYTATVPTSVTSVTVTPTASGPNATIQVRINGGAFDPVVSGSASDALALNVGANTIEVKVTAQDGTTIKSYDVIVMRVNFQLYLPLIKR